ncbi:MAG: ATP-binding protein [Rhodothermaceae bacterium]
MNNEILFVDDDKLLILGIQKKYEEKYPLTLAYSAKEALNLLKSGKRYSIIISDYYMPGMNGIDFLKEVEQYDRDAIKVLITGNADINMAIDAVNYGNVFRFICKPFNYDVFSKIIQDCFLQYKLINIEKVERIKSDIISILSHEIRTPVTAINNNLYLMKSSADETLSEKMIEYLDRIEATNKKLVSSVNKIEYLSQILTGNIKLKKESLKLKEAILNPVMDEFIMNNSKDDFHFNFNSEMEDLLLFCDEKSIYQIIYEIVDNAYKFSNGADIDICLHEKEQRPELTISDKGIGISTDFEKLSELFYQEDKGSSRMFNGNGLGLTLVKKLCDLNDIEIDFKENEPRGTTVRLILN